MEKTDQEIRDIIIQALIDSAPDQIFAAELAANDPGLFQKKTMGKIFEIVGLESLGWLWFATLLEEKLPLRHNIKMEVFFAENADKYLDDLIRIFKGYTKDE